MKSFITNTLQAGKHILPFQVEGPNNGDLKSIFHQSRIQLYGLPPQHSLSAAWPFRIVLDRGWIVDFSSATNSVGGWQEIGSLNIHFSISLSSEEDPQFIMTDVHNFTILKCERLTYNEPDIYAECGIVFTSQTGSELLVAAGTSPGSVSIRPPFSSDPFAPEFEMDKYKRHEI